MLNGDGRAGLVADRPVVELAQAAVGHEREHRDARARDQRARARTAAPRPRSRRRVGGEQRGERQRRELRRRARAHRRAARRRAEPRAGGSSVSASSAATQASATSESFEFVSSANARVRDTRPRRSASATPSIRPSRPGAQPQAEQQQAGRGQQVEGDRRAVGRREVVPAPAPRQRLLERHVGEVGQRPVGVAALDVVARSPRRRAVAVHDPVGADHARVAHVDHVRVHDVQRRPERRAGTRAPTTSSFDGDVRHQRPGALARAEPGHEHPHAAGRAARGTRAAPTSRSRRG